MGEVVKIKRSRRRDRQQVRRKANGTRLAFAAAGVGIGVAGGLFLIGAARDVTLSGPDFVCGAVRVIDGDTFDCDDIRIRMQGIDAPEMPGHCRRGRDCTPGDPYASDANLRRLIQSGEVQCRKTDTDRYGRTVARCHAGEVDLSCKQIEGGFAVRRYGAIWCD